MSDHGSHDGGHRPAWLWLSAKRRFAAVSIWTLDFIAADGGSMDPGPHYLGEGVPFVTRMAIKRDIGLMLDGALDKGIPMLIGSAGGGGSAPQVALVREVVEEIAAERVATTFKMAVIHADQQVRNICTPSGAAARLSRWGRSMMSARRRSTKPIALSRMMGVEPFQEALRNGSAGGSLLAARQMHRFTRLFR